MRLAPVLAWAAAAAATPPRGFLLVATNLPVQLLRSDADADWRRDDELVLRHQHHGHASSPSPAG